MKRYTIGLITGILLTASSVMFIGAKMQNDEIVAKRIRIVNDKGTTLVVLRKNSLGGGQFVVNDREGNLRVVITGFYETGGVSVSTQNFDEGVTIIGQAINFVNKESNDIVNISNKDGHGAINLMDRNGNYGWGQSGKVK